MWEAGECCVIGMILLVPVKRVRVVLPQSLVIGNRRNEAKK